MSDLNPSPFSTPLLPSKVRAPYGAPIDEPGARALDQLAADEAIDEVVVLPSFKLKQTRVAGMAVTRCDDVVLRASTPRASLSEYQIGCGFLAVKLTLAPGTEAAAVLQRALVSGLAELHRPALHSQRRLLRRWRGLPPKVHTRLPESTPSAAWLACAAAGPSAYLAATGDRWALLRHRDRLLHDTPLEGALAALRPLLSAAWQQGPGRPDDEALFSLTGSHYLDVHHITDPAPAAPTLVVHLHAHGSSFPELLTPAALADASRGTLDGMRFMQLVALMNNAATLNRLGIVLRLLRHLERHAGPVSAELLTDQSHHDVIRTPAGPLLYYNDSQRLEVGRTTVLPAGYPLTDSWLITAGPNPARLLNGISHNLKLPIRLQGTRPSGDGQVLLLEAHDALRFSRFLPRRPTLDTRSEPHAIAPGAEALVEHWQRDGIIRTVARLRPLLRFHVRRNHETPWSRIGL